MSQRCMFALPIVSDVNNTYTPTFSGGSWSGTLTLANLQSGLMSLVARSSAATLVSTKFDVDLKRAAEVRVISIPKHTLSTAAKIRITGASDAAFTTSLYGPTAWLDVFPAIYPAGTLPSTHPAYATSKLTAEEFAEGYNIGFVHVIATAAQTLRYWRIEIDDTTNAAGYVDLARLVIAPVWQPSINFSQGAGLGWGSATTVTDTEGGGSLFNEKPPKRTYKFGFDIMPEDEALVWPFDVNRKYGGGKQLFFIGDPDDTYHMHRRSMLCTVRSPTPLEWPYSVRINSAFQLTEVI